MMHLDGPAQLQNLLQDLPVVLRAKMLRHMHHGKHMNLEFFAKYSDDDLFAYMVPLMTTSHFDSSDMIYINGDYAERVYFLCQGCVFFFTADHASSKALKRREGGGSKSVYERVEQHM